ncbi:MAG: hypothetical protein E6K71_09645 [Candidatus Eisenbacteria bacterium]|uniref:Gingipain domain-containing protein n=1 Tax=Eiseniibacteriota bacterium TaxID=2212470 RepID=A0A538S818_UNCEI|nr:MAG: hypothetical protein E6K71_09645 [Candidatus Eisenbacteria bacterium]
MTPFPRAFYNAVLGPPAESLTKGNPLIHLATRRLFSVTIGFLVLSASGASAAGPPYRATSQDARGVTFEIAPSSARFDSTAVEGAPYVRVSLQGAHVTEPPGRPALPTLMIPVGVPDGMSAKARIVSAEWEERGGLPPPVPVAKQRFVGEDPKSGPVSEFRYEPDPSIYGRGNVWPGEIVTMGEGGPLGDSWMMPALVRPVRYDPGHKRFLVLKRMTLRVEFAAATTAQLKVRPAVRPGADANVWQRVKRSLLGNYESARAFPRRVTPGALRAPRLSIRRAAANPEFRVSVGSTGWSSVSFAALSAAGFPAGISISQVGVWERGYDDVGDSATSTPIPVVARDVNSNGTFDGGDAITFYARNLRDRVGALSIENRYAYANVYWVSWTAAPAAVPDSISGVISDPAPATPTSFRDTIHLEQNISMMARPNTGAGSPAENVEYMFWTDGSAPDQFSAPVPFVHPDVSAPFRVQARYQGESTTATHRINSFFQSSTGVTDTIGFNRDFFGQEIYLFDTGFNVPGSVIGPGTNQYQHQGLERFGAGSFIQGSGSLLDWVEVTYSRLYVADLNRLEFTSGQTAGVAELHVGGFTQPGIVVYDVTVSTTTLRVTGATVNTLGPGNYEVVFRTDATAGTRRFVALVPGAELPVAGGAIQADTPSNLGVPGAFPAGGLARSILVTPEAFLAPANRLAAYRRGQGYVVEVAGIQDIYDEFSGGIKSATAIRRYFQHAFDTWTPRPSYAVLLGDASMDYRKDLLHSAVDWIPTYMAFEAVAGPPGYELIAQDGRYVLNLGRGTSSPAQYTPSIFLGRVPASSATELDQFVTKLIQYENFQPTDSWRGNQLLFSDDEYSTTIFFNSGYCRQPVEANFKAASQYMENATAASASGSDIHSELFDLKGITDALASCCQTTPDCRSLTGMVLAIRSGGGAPLDSFFTQLARGSLIFNAEAHANRRLIAHEQIFNMDYGDLNRIANVGRPFFYMVWGCHANQFPDAPSANDIDSTDSFAEQWVMMPDRGAIGGLGSTAYEILDTNAAMNGYVADAFYTTPPVAGGVARWIMGEVVGQANVMNANSNYYYQQEMNKTIALLGEPMTRMDALPPRVFEVTVDGNPYPEGAPLVAVAANDSLTIVAKTRDEAGLKKTELVERAVGSGAITPVDPTLYSVAASDTGRAQTLTGHYRPHIGNYDLLVRSTDTNGREQSYALQVRSTVRYLANGVVVVNGTFVESNAVLRAEATTPIPVTQDSLTLLLDGVPLANVTKTAMDATNRRWALQAPAMDLTRGAHTLDVQVSGRAGIFAQGSFKVETALTLRRVAVVSPRLMGTGCDGSVFQFELSTATPTVQLMLLTVSGRRVASLEWPGKAGFNVYCWDGRDSQGNVAGTGLYFYRLTAIDASGHKATQNGRMIRTR